MIKKLLLAVLLAQGAYAENLGDAVEKAVKNHPAAARANAISEAARNNIDVAYGEFLPDVTLGLSGGREHVENATSTADRDRHRTLNRYDASISVRQRLFGGHRYEAAYHRSKHEYSQRSEEREVVCQDLARRTMEAYIAVLRNRELQRLAATNVSYHEQILEKIKERFDKKIAREADVIQVQGRLALAQAQLKRELANSGIVEADYKEIVGELPPENLENPETYLNLFPKNVKKAVEKANANNPDLKADVHNVAATKESVKEAKGLYYPEIFLELRASEGENFLGSRSNNDAVSLLLTSEWNVFNGFSDKYLILSREYLSQAAEERMKERRRAIARDLEISWSNRKGTIIELNYFVKNEDAAQQTLAAFEKQYELQTRTLFDVLNARTELYQSSIRVIEGRFENVREGLSIYSQMTELRKNLKAMKKP